MVQQGIGWAGGSDWRSIAMVRAGEGRQKEGRGGEGNGQETGGQAVGRDSDGAGSLSMEFSLRT